MKENRAKRVQINQNERY